MANLMDHFNKIIYKNNIDISKIDAASQKAFKANATKLANDYKTLAEAEAKIDASNLKIINIKKKGAAALTKTDEDIIKSLQNDVDKYGREYIETNKKLGKLHDHIINKYHLSNEQMNNLGDIANKNSSLILEGNKKYTNSLYDFDKAIKGGSDVMIESGKMFLAEFGMIGQALGLVIEQMNELNKKLIEFNRNMSLGFSNDLLGMDLYGNSTTSSLATISAGNNISEDQFLKAFDGLNKGNALNAGNNGSAQEVKEFGIETARISKLYGVEMSNLTDISSNLVYTYGMKIKDVNKVFVDGKNAAVGAGVSVKKYFQNLKEATDLLGSQYIAGGIKGLGDLALYASKTDQSIQSIMKTADAFKNYGESFEKQNNAAALGMQSTAQQTSKIWSLEFLGRKEEADQLYKGSVVKDIFANNMVDKDGNIDARGQRSLEGMGMDAEQIKSIQKLVNMQKNYGISIDQLNNKNNESLDIQSKIIDYEYKNLTISEKFQAMWGKIKGAIIDPLASIISPLFDITMNLLGTAVDVLSPILKLFGYPLMMLGKTLTSISNSFSFVFAYISAGMNKVSTGLDKIVDNLGFFSKAILTTVGVLMSIALLGAGGKMGFGRAGRYVGGAINKIPFVGSSRLGRTANVLANRGMNIAPRNARMAGLSGKVFGGISKGGIGLGLLGGLAGGIIDGMVDKDENGVGKTTGGKAAMVGSSALQGAAIGSMIPVFGTAIGAIAGAIYGLVTQFKPVRDFLSKIWGVLSSILGSIWNVVKYLNPLWWIKEGVVGLYDLATKDDNKEDLKAANAIVNNPYIGLKALNDVQKIVDYRHDEKNSFIKEKDQAETMQKVFAPSIIIKQSFDGSIKTRIQGK